MIDKYGLELKEFHFHDAVDKKCHLVLGEGDMDLTFYKTLISNQYVVLEVKSSEDLKKSINVFKDI